MRRSSQPAAPQSATRILVIDDEPDMLTNYRRILRRAGHTCIALGDPLALESHLTQHKPDLVLTDLVMPGASGMDVIERVRRHDPNIPVIMITAHGSIENAVEVMKHHAADYLTKPFCAEELYGKIQSVLSNRLIERTGLSDGKGPMKNQRWRHEIIGVSPALERILDLTRRVARTDVNVLIVGESGTGKELLARAIHRLSGRSEQIFVPVDCTSLPENLLESELFGYVKGAFTGATSDKMGLFEFADKGTLFLDEIGEMPIALQAKLLRVLQERTFRPIGGREQIGIDVRVVAASNRDLEKALKDRAFRSDLYYRLNVVTLTLPPLRDRAEDVALLASHFLDRFASENRLILEAISEEAMDCLKCYRWPGNVRELQNVIEHAATLATASTIRFADLPETLQRWGEAKLRQPAAPPQLFPRKQHLVAHFERDYLVSLLVTHQLNVSRAAESAGCHRRTLYRMINRHNLDLRTLRENHQAKAGSRKANREKRPN